MKKIFLTIANAVLALTLSAAPAELKNSSMQITVQPENGGKITAMRSPGFSFQLTPEQIRKNTPGLGKVRVFGDNAEYMSGKWETVGKSDRSLVLRIAGQPPQRNLEITKTYSLPSDGNYVKVELKLKNRKPIEGGFKVVPWIHNAFLPDSGAHTFYLAHRNGVEQMDFNPKLTVQSALKNPGNWILSFSPEQRQGLLMVSENKPEAVYCFASKNISSLEMLFPAVDPAQEKSIVFYLAPVAELNSNALNGTGIPVKLDPAFSAQHSPGERIDVISHFKNAGEKNIPVNFRFWKSEAAISPDVSLPLTFGIRKLKAGAISLEIDLPEFAELTGHTGKYWSHIQEDMNLKWSKPVVHDGQKYIRYHFEVTCKDIPVWFHSHCRILVRAKQNEGNAPIYYRGIHNGQITMEEKVPCRIIRIPAAKTPRNFKLLMGADYSLIHAWKDFSGTMKHLGINGICTDWSIPNQIISAEQVKAMNSRLKGQGFMTSTMGIFYVPARKSYTVDTDLRAVDIDGRKATCFDFTLRGDWMNAVADKAAKFMNLGYDLIISDYEPYFGGERYSFTPHTEKMFRQYFQTRHPNLKYVDPKEIARNPERLPEHHRIWVEFKCSQFADYLKSVVEQSRRLAEGKTGIGLCTIPGSSEESIRMDNLSDNRKFGDILDYNMPMLYDNLYRTMPAYHRTVDLFRQMSAGKKATVFPTLTLGFWGEGNPFPPEHSFFLLLETALTQCQGAYIFPGFSGSDNLGILYLSKAMNLIAEIEPYLDGAVRQDQQVKIRKCRNTDQNLPAAVEPVVLIKGKQMLVWLAEYSADTIRLAADFQLPADCKVKVLSGPDAKTLLRKGELHEVTLTPGTDKGQLLLLETIDGNDFPIRSEKTDEEVSRQDPHLIFYDSFDGTTKGKNGSASHFYQLDSAGKKGGCLFMRDYESFWILPQKFELPEKELTVEFHFKASRIFKAKSRSMWDLMRGNLGDSQLFWLFFDPATGKICLAVGKKQNGKVVDWPVRLLSQTDSWPANVWMPVKLNLGQSGITLTVNGKTEIVSTKPVWFKTMDSLQIGRPFVSSGRFDELKLYDTKK